MKHARPIKRLLVCGSRNWRNYEAIASILDSFPREITIVHGGAKTGADYQVARYCRERGVATEVYEPCYDDPTVSKRQAPRVRNEFMLLTEPDHVLAFWDRESKGTEMVLQMARKLGITTETWLA